MKTPSTSVLFKSTYTISISEHTRRILNNRSLQSQMYFGPGIEAETKLEDLLLNTRTKKQELEECSELPRIFASSARKKQSQNAELWLSEITYLTDPFNVIEIVTVWLQNTLKPPYYQFYVKEILYSYEGFVPFGEEFDDVMKLIIDEIKILEKGTLMNIAGQNI
ncbi:hypothetical protein F8M41_002381 [Gigaspora margarita]|uniref:Uncharacterized protein n=1 Tax=Gigaspora margarita TaxID=4874 RepID=A0A8H3XCZ0_GIGMA|nr:hypothetical protein F8M41_002381 [Gigaspora margarita]